MTTKARITYSRIPAGLANGDYVAERFAVLLDGTKVCEVTKERRTQVIGYAHSMLGRSSTATAWQAEGTLSSGRGYRAVRDYSTRMDAVADFLVDNGSTWTEARELVGKRGL